MALPKVRAGQKLAIQAQTWNRIIEATERTLGPVDQSAQTGYSRTTGNVVVAARNSSGSYLGRFDIAGVKGVVFTKSDNELQFYEHAMLDLETRGADHVGRWVVAQEPIPDGKIGKVLVAGVTPVCMYEVYDDDHTCADLIDDSGYALRSCAVGCADILWKEGTGENKWALVHLGGPSHGVYDTPVEMDSTDATADTTDWAIDDDVSSNFGLFWTVLSRIHWTGDAGDPIYVYYRDVKLDDQGRIIEVSGETRSTLADTGACDDD